MPIQAESRNQVHVCSHLITPYCSQDVIHALESLLVNDNDVTDPTRTFHELDLPGGRDPSVPIACGRIGIVGENAKNILNDSR